MANRQFFQFTQSLERGLTYLRMQATMNGASAPTLLQGDGITSFSRVSAGVYKIVLQNNYYRFLSMESVLRAPNAAPVAVTAASIGTVVSIVTLGTTTQASFVAMGMPSDIVAAVGVSFAVVAVGTGSGTVAVAAPSASACIQVIGDPSLNLVSNVSPSLYILNTAATSASVTTPIATDIETGAVLRLGMLLRNSSVKGKGE